MEKAKTAVIYCRQSYTRDSDKLSISEQSKKAYEYAENSGISIIAPPFIDENTSSELYPLTDDAKMIASRDQTFLAWLAESQRHSIQYGKRQIPYKINLGACFDFIKKKQVDYLIVWSFERLGRSEYSSCLQPFITDFLKSNDVKLVETKDATVTDYNNSNNQLLALIKSHIEYESLKTKKKSSINIIKNRIANAISASNAYGVVKKGKNIYFDPQKAKVIKYIFESVNRGLPYADILYKLNSDFAEYKTEGAQKFYESSIYNIAKNPVYCGLMRYKEGNIERLKEAKNIPKPIINIALFYAVRENMKYRKECTRNLSSNPFGSKKHLPLSRLIYCKCGNPMSVVYDNENLLYDCRKINGRINSGCSNVRIRMKQNDPTIKGCGLYDVVQKLFIIAFADKLQNSYQVSVYCEEENKLLTEIFNKQKDMNGALEILKENHRLDIFKESFELMNQELSALEQKLKEVRLRKYQNLEKIDRQLKEIFNKIIHNQKIKEDDFWELSRKTIRKITVDVDKINIELIDGNNFDMPRLVGKRNVKSLPPVKIQVEEINAPYFVNSWQKKFHIVFKVKSRGRQTVLVDTPSYRISIKQ